MKIRRDQYFPLPRGMALPSSPRVSYLAMTGALSLSAAISAGGALCSVFFPDAGASFVFRSAYAFFHSAVLFGFALYLINLSGLAVPRRGVFRWLFCMPLLLGGLLVLTNPLSHFLFFPDGTEGIQYGAGRWSLTAINAVYIALGCASLFRKKNALSKNKRKVALFLLMIAAAGTLIRPFISIPIELLFEAVAVFGAMVLLEEEGELRRRNDQFRPGILLAVSVVFLR